MNREIPGAESENLNAPGIFVSSEHFHTYQSEECRLIHEAMAAQIKELRRVISDHEQRFDTLQTPFLKRLIFWLDGWPWHDLNAEKRSYRPWHKWGGKR